MTKWQEIFRGGTQTAVNGKDYDGDAIIDRALATFDPSWHEPPVVIGHPKHDAPAYGWVEGLRKVVKKGKAVLEASYKDLAPEFVDLVGQGRFKKRSASFYPDGRLRHVGFLGAAPPAVKGLADTPAFKEGDADADAVFEFSDPYQQGLLARILRRLREHFIAEAGPETAERLLPDWEIEEVGREPDSPAAAADASLSLFTEPPKKGGTEMKFSEFMQAINIFKKLGGKDEDIDLIAPAAPAAPPASGPEKSFSEADIEAAKAAAAEEAKAQARAEFAESEKKRKKDAAKAEIASFCDAGIKAGTLAPAWVDAGIAQFMEGLADDEDAAISFAEGEEKKTPSAWFREFLEGLPKLVEFSEVATRDKNVAGGNAGGKLETLTREHMEKNKELSYSAAFSEVQRANPDLAAEYAVEIGQG